jgi:transcriptional regulator with XRE-family HTH domain
MTPDLARRAALADLDSDVHPLRKRRLAAGLSARALADRAGVHFQTVYGIERRRVTPGDDVLWRLALALDASASDLRP